jgi:pimeloyl-ACP methyl ester carboxylesterase
MVCDVLAVLDALEIDRAHFWGYSMGGAIGLGLARDYPDRVISLIAGGVDTLFAPVKSGGPSPMLEIFQRGVAEGADAVVEGMRAWAGGMNPQWEERLRGLDLQAMVAYLDPTRPRASVLNALPHMNLPCLLYAGERDEDAYRNGAAAAQVMPDARFVSLPGLNHGGAAVAVDAIMPHVLAFLTAL